MTRALRRLARALGWPIRRVLAPRFDDTHRRLADLEQRVYGELSDTRSDAEEGFKRLESSLGEYARATRESMALAGRELGEMRHVLEDFASRLDRDRERQLEDLGGLALERRVSHMLSESSAQLDPDLVRLVDWSQSHDGPAAQYGLWLNPAVSVEHGTDGVSVADVNERIVEVPFAFMALADLPAGARILDVGAGESTVALSLASLGFAVTALDPQPYPFEHPCLEVVTSRLEDWGGPAEPFDAVLCISTIEHVGLGWYGEAPQAGGADARFIGRLAELLSDGGTLVLTTPFGAEPSVDDVQRTYDDQTLDDLLAGWEIVTRATVSRTNRVTWTAAPQSDHAVALVVARRQRS